MFVTGNTNYCPSTLKDHVQKTVTNEQLEKRHTQKQKHQVFLYNLVKFIKLYLPALQLSKGSIEWGIMNEKQSQS